MSQLTPNERRRLLTGLLTVQQQQRARQGEYLTWENTDDGAVLSVNGQVERHVTFADVEPDLLRLRGLLTPPKPHRPARRGRPRRYVPFKTI